MCRAQFGPDTVTSTVGVGERCKVCKERGQPKSRLPSGTGGTRRGQTLAQRCGGYKVLTDVCKGEVLPPVLAFVSRWESHQPRPYH